MKVLQNLMNAAKRLWTRFDDFLTAQADRQVNGWGASMEYKRTYTNPDTAKRFRQTS